MNSMAQQAVPKGMGHRLLDRAQLTRKSSRVVTQLGETDDTTEDTAEDDMSARESLAGPRIGLLLLVAYGRAPYA